MSAPIMTPRAEQIAEELLEDAKTFASLEGSDLPSRQIRAVIKATARHLAGLEAVLQQRTEQKP